MSFLDEQASGQIGVGQSATLRTLTDTKRRRKRSQTPKGAETYSLMPQNEFTGIVSSPTDLQQVGIGNLLLSQGASAAGVQNVFEKYAETGAAAIGSVSDVLYPQPTDDGDDDDDDDDDDLVTGSDPYIGVDSADSGIYDPDSTNYQGAQVGMSTSAQITSTLESAPAIFDEQGNKVEPETFFQTALKGAAKLSPALYGLSKLFGGRDTSEDRPSKTYELPKSTYPGSGAMIPKGTALTPIADYKGSSTKGGPQGGGMMGFPSANAFHLDLGLEAGLSSTGGTGGSTSTIGGTSAPMSAGGLGRAAFDATPTYTGDTDNSDPYDGDGDGGGYFSDISNWASGGTVKSKNKNSFMSMKGK
tara:strand:- start:169 stop:1245 length:1077 start_codon:yes stop_codon:yes gene_type:complete